jgi:hypothetical protein
MTNGWPTPASRRTRCQWGRSDGLGGDGRRFNQEGSDLKTWPATTRSFRFKNGCKPETLAAFRSALSSEGKAAGVGQPFTVVNLNRAAEFEI